MTIYEEHGFNSRVEYLYHLADEHGVYFENVEALADILGPGEDFDGLVATLEDHGGDFEAL